MNYNSLLIFLVALNNRWGYFPSISAAWRITQESFLQNQQLFNDLKLRAGYGISGNSLGFDPLNTVLRYGSRGKFYYNGDIINSIAPVKDPNDDLKWEETAMLNIGLDFTILNGKLSGTLEYYNKTTSDLIFGYPVSQTQYYGSTYHANVGEMQNRGFETSLTVKPIQSKDFTWQSTFNVSFNKNEITSLSNDDFQMDYTYMLKIGDHGQSGNFAQIIEEGKPLGEFYLWKYAGKNKDGISQFYNKDGELTITPSGEDHFYAGSAQPKATGGWHNTLTYKKITLDFLFRGVTGNKILNATLANLNYPAEATHYNMPKITLDESPNDTGAHYVSDRYLEKGDYIRLDNITLSYTINPKLSGIKKIRFYSSVNNAFIITNYKGTDPEVYMGGITPGADNNNYYPKTRTIMFGLNVNF